MSWVGEGVRGSTAAFFATALVVALVVGGIGLVAVKSVVPPRPPTPTPAPWNFSGYPGGYVPVAPPPPPSLYVTGSGGHGPAVTPADPIEKGAPQVPR